MFVQLRSDFMRYVDVFEPLEPCRHTNILHVTEDSSLMSIHREKLIYNNKLIQFKLR